MISASSAQNVQAAQVASLGPAASAPSAIAAPQQSSQDDSGFSFGDFLDIVNPLQHLPIVGTLYRAITGDKIGDVEQVAGDGLYGGLMGLGSSVANLIFKKVTGKDFGDTVLAWAEDAIGMGDKSPAAVADTVPATPATQTAATQTAPAQPAAAQTAAAQTDPSQAPATHASLFNAPLALPPAQLASAAPRPLSPQPVAFQAANRQPPSPLPVAQAGSMLADPDAFLASLAAQGVDPALGMRAMAAYQKTLGMTAAAQP
jgi:hypothetical protein